MIRFLTILAVILVASRKSPKQKVKTDMAKDGHVGFMFFSVGIVCLKATS